MSAKTLLPLRSDVAPGVIIVPTRNVLSVELSREGLYAAHCRNSRAQQHRNSSSSSSSSFGHSVVRPLLQSAVVPVDLFAAVLHRETFTALQLVSEARRQKDLVGLYAHNLQSLHNRTASSLAGVGLTTIKDVKSLSKESRADFSQSVNGAFVAKGRESIKKPFWKSCQHSLLRDVVTQGYSS